MATPGTLSSAHRGRHLGRRTVATLLAGATAFAGVMLVPGPAQARPSTAGSDITIIQANLLSPQADRRFQRDAAEVLQLRAGPDHLQRGRLPQGRLPRPSGVRHLPPHRPVPEADPGRLAHRPLHRSRPRAPSGSATGAAARPARRPSSAGAGPTGSRSAPTTAARCPWCPPTSPPRPGACPTCGAGRWRGSRVLVDRLAARGPVLVGGDFNMHYLSSAYPEDLFEAADLKSTFELMGTRFATGDHARGHHRLPLHPGQRAAHRRHALPGRAELRPRRRRRRALLGRRSRLHGDHGAQPAEGRPSGSSVPSSRPCDGRSSAPRSGGACSSPPRTPSSPASSGRSAARTRTASACR